MSVSLQDQRLLVLLERFVPDSSQADVWSWLQHMGYESDVDFAYDVLSEVNVPAAIAEVVADFQQVLFRRASRRGAAGQSSFNAGVCGEPVTQDKSIPQAKPLLPMQAVVSPPASLPPTVSPLWAERFLPHERPVLVEVVEDLVKIFLEAQDKSTLWNDLQGLSRCQREAFLDLLKSDIANSAISFFVEAMDEMVWEERHRALLSFDHASQTFSGAG